MITPLIIYNLRKETTHDAFKLARFYLGYVFGSGYVEQWKTMKKLTSSEYYRTVAKILNVVIINLLIEMK